MKFELKEDIEEISVVEEPSEEVKNAALVQMINDSINSEWDSLNKIKSNIATLESEAPEQDEIKEILKTILMEKTIHIGMLTKALSLLDKETQDLMDAGVEKAEAVISEPAKDLE
jgi:bacterioferritin (cytochrome b1)